MHLPSPARSFLFQKLQATNEYCDEFLVATCDRQRSLNQFAGVPANPYETEHIYTKPSVEVWIATISETSEEASSVAEEASEVQESGSGSESREL